MFKRIKENIEENRMFIALSMLALIISIIAISSNEAVINECKATCKDLDLEFLKLEDNLFDDNCYCKDKENTMRRIY